jgi:hypothetical protein
VFSRTRSGTVGNSRSARDEGIQTPTNSSGIQTHANSSGVQTPGSPDTYTRVSRHPRAKRHKRKDTHRNASRFPLGERAHSPNPFIPRRFEAPGDAWVRHIPLLRCRMFEHGPRYIPRGRHAAEANTRRVPIVCWSAEDHRPTTNRITRRRPWLDLRLPVVDVIFVVTLETNGCGTPTDRSQRQPKDP